MIEENPQFISLLWKRALIGRLIINTQLILKVSFINNFIISALTAIAEYCFLGRNPSLTYNLSMTNRLDYFELYQSHAI